MSLEEEIVGTFHETELQKTNLEEIRTEKLIKNDVDKLYIKG